MGEHNIGLYLAVKRTVVLGLHIMYLNFYTLSKTYKRR